MKNDRYYQKCITFGRAAEGLRADFQEQLIEMQREIGFEYVRFHGIFHDDMAIYSEENGEPILWFGYIDKLFDFLLDNGYNEGFFMQYKEMSEFLSKKLHPIQFIELSARFAYKSYLFNRLPQYIMDYNTDTNQLKSVICSPIYGDAYDYWNNEMYANLLYNFLKPYGFNFDNIFKNGQLYTYLRNIDGTFKDFYNEQQGNALRKI